MVTVDSVVFICFSFSFVCILSLTYLTWVKLVLMRYTKRALDDFPFGGFLSKCLFSLADEGDDDGGGGVGGGRCVD